MISDKDEGCLVRWRHFDRNRYKYHAYNRDYKELGCLEFDIKEHKWIWNGLIDLPLIYFKEIEKKQNFLDKKILQIRKYKNGTR
jgi:hypothetical protein